MTPRDNPFCVYPNGWTTNLFEQAITDWELNALCEWAGSSDWICNLMIDTLSNHEDIGSVVLTKLEQFIEVEKQCRDDWTQFIQTVPSAVGDSNLSPMRNHMKRAVDQLAKPTPQTEDALKELQSALDDAKMDSERYRKKTMDFREGVETQTVDSGSNTKSVWWEVLCEYAWDLMMGIVIAVAAFVGISMVNLAFIMAMGVSLQVVRIVNDVGS